MYARRNFWCITGCVPFAFGLVGLVFSQVPDSSRTQSEPPRDVAEVFRSILPQVKAKAEIPILLPSELPQPIENAEYPFIKTADSTRYEIFLYFEELPGVEATFAASFEGKVGPLPAWSKKGKQVNLANGIAGYFSPRSCGISCTPVLLQWEENDVSYGISLKLAVINELEQETCITAIANSAIRGGPR